MNSCRTLLKIAGKSRIHWLSPSLLFVGYTAAKLKTPLLVRGACWVCLGCWELLTDART
jgi:hypothetical protein